MPDFVPGLELSRRFYRDVVAPLLSERLPELRYSAALLGPGSEVLGFDDERSTDHDWGPRVQLFVADGEVERRDEIALALTNGLPDAHTLHIVPLGSWLAGHLGVDPRAGMSLTDWLAAPTQRLATVIGGEVFADQIGELTAVRSALSWYPDDVWRYVMACQWQRIAEEEPFVGRCGEVGDELGSAIVAARLARDVMRLALLQNRRYPPYSKWLGRAFATLPGTTELQTSLTAAVAANRWREREAALATALTAIGQAHNDLRLTAPISSDTRYYYDRPFRVLGADRFTAALLATIADDELRTRPLVGSVDQWVDSTAALTDVAFLHDLLRPSGP